MSSLLFLNIFCMNSMKMTSWFLLLLLLLLNNQLIQLMLLHCLIIFRWNNSTDLIWNVSYRWICYIVNLLTCWNSWSVQCHDRAFTKFKIAWGFLLLFFSSYINACILFMFVKKIVVTVVFYNVFWASITTAVFYRHKMRRLRLKYILIVVRTLSLQICFFLLLLE